MLPGASKPRGITQFGSQEMLGKLKDNKYHEVRLRPVDASKCICSPAGGGGLTSLSQTHLAGFGEGNREWVMERASEKKGRRRGRKGRGKGRREEEWKL